MTKLSVNLNKVALIRNARGGNYPDLIKVAADCESFGADGITVHPRPDERHVRFSDLLPLKEVVATEFNIEGYPSGKFIEEVCRVVPHQVTLVPDAPDALTSDSGWDTIKHAALLKDVIAPFKEKGIRVSIFLNAEARLVEGALRSGADRIELYTGPYADSYHSDREKAIEPFVETAREAGLCGLGLNAGHDLNLDNLHFFYTRVPNLLEVSIGHALISDALYYGLRNTILMYKRLLKNK